MQELFADAACSLLWRSDGGQAHVHMTEVRLSSCGGVSGEVGASSDATVRPRGSRELWCCPGEKVFSVGVVSRRQTQLAHPRTAALTAAHQRVGGGNPSGGRDGGSAGMWTAGGGGSAKHASHTAQRPAVATMAELLEFLSVRSFVSQLVRLFVRPLVS